MKKTVIRKSTNGNPWWCIYLADGKFDIASTWAEACWKVQRYHNVFGRKR